MLKLLNAYFTVMTKALRYRQNDLLNQKVYEMSRGIACKILKCLAPFSIPVEEYKYLRALLLMEPIGTAQPLDAKPDDSVAHPHLFPVVFEVLNRAEPLCQVRVGRRTDPRCQRHLLKTATVA